MYFYLLLFVDVDIHDHLVIVGYIVFLRDDNFCILKAFIIKVALNQSFGAVNDIRGHLSALNHTDPAFYILAL